MGEVRLIDIAERGELLPATELQTYWSAFCDCDRYPDRFDDRMERAGLIELDDVTDDDLEDGFARERGIEPGGFVWRLTDLGRQALKDAPK